MSLFSQLVSTVRGAGSSVPRVTAPERIDLERGMVRVPRLGFFGVAYPAPGGRWLVGCRDSDGKSRGGGRASGNGQVVLLDLQTKRVMLTLDNIARPTHGAVADDGSFLILDTGFGTKLESQLVAISQAGVERFRKKYQANLYTVDGSPCGRYAVAQTCNAPKSPHSNLLECLDLSTGQPLFSISPVTPWTKQYRFEVVAGQLSRLLVNPDGMGWFAYSASGAFLDKAPFQAAELSKGDYGTRTMAVERLLKDTPGLDAATQALEVLDGVLAEVEGKHPDWAAQAYRLAGEALERLSRTGDAIGAYELALSLNPKVGCSRRLAVLRKTIR